MYSHSKKSPDCFALGKSPATKQKVKRDVTGTKAVFCQCFSPERDETTGRLSGFQQYLNKVTGHMLWTFVLWLCHTYRKFQWIS